MSEKVKILLADDHPIVRQGLRTAIEREADFSVIGEAGNGGEALKLIETLQPDVCILDIDMPEKNGFEVVREINKRRLRTEIIFLTVHREADLLNEALELDVKGYVLKDSALAEIVLSLRAVISGNFFTSPAMTSYLIRRKKKPSERNLPDNLTETERRVLKLLAEYKTSKEIAKELFISPRTVDTHRANISQKLDLQGSHALMKFAIANKDRL